MVKRQKESAVKVRGMWSVDKDYMEGETLLVVFFEDVSRSGFCLHLFSCRARELGSNVLQY